MRILRLNLKRKWWEQIKAGTKREELRLATDYWRKRLEGREYDEVHLLLGYPKRGDESRTIRRKWAGYREVELTHEEFGPLPVDVLAIDVSRVPCR